MNSNTTSTLLAMVTALSGPALTAPRALLVQLDSSGNLQYQPIGMGQSLLRIETELFDHFNSKPISEAFLVELRDYAAGRLTALDEARATQGFVIPRAQGKWEIVHAPAWQSLTIGGPQ